MYAILFINVHYKQLISEKEEIVALNDNYNNTKKSIKPIRFKSARVKVRTYVLFGNLEETKHKILTFMKENFVSRSLLSY